MTGRIKTRSTRSYVSPSIGKQIAGVILCGGKGTRMGRTISHKVCEPIAGRPAINRLIDTLRHDGVDPIVVVVGHRAGDVVETVGSTYPGVHFVFQRDRLGTGHAARIGIEALAQFGFDGTVLVTMGDKWLAPGLIAKANRRLFQSGASLLAASTAKRPESTAGRFVSVPGRGIVGIVEVRDIQRARLLDEWLHTSSNRKTLSKAALRRIGLKHIRPAAKLWRALGPLARFSRGTGSVRATELTQAIKETGTQIKVGGYRMAPETVEQRSRTVNESMYLAHTPTLLDALHRVGRANAQDEHYLTDVVEILGQQDSPAARQVVEFRIDHDDVMAFNTREELKRIEKHVRLIERRNAPPPMDRAVRQSMQVADGWLELLGSKRGRPTIERNYGVAGPLVNDRLKAMRRIVQLFAREFGDDGKLLLVRAPGRLNLMGRHIDHQGGFVHSMALDCEILMAVRRRRDDVICMANADSVAFPKRELVIGDWINALRADDWLGFVDGPAVQTHLLSTAGDWSNYVLASALYQQYHHPQRRLCGMDMAVAGNVPMAAGLSSSSSLVVAAMEAFTSINGIRVEASDIVSACGQAEWFVGSRGGAADHAAIRLGKEGHAVRMSFHPFRVVRNVPIGDDAALLIAYSGQHAVKSAGARDRFNERVACYRLGILLLRKMYPKYAKQLQHIRDVSSGRLKISPKRVLEMIHALPNDITRANLRQQLRHGKKDLDRIFSSHTDPGAYTIRDVVTYGVGECHRSQVAAGLLDRGNLSGFGELMLRSHDGDRVSGNPAFTESSFDDGKPLKLSSLIGEYACSTDRLDELVDRARGTPGVYGAQLAGAGLGGCVMILADRSAVRRVSTTLARDYYEPRGMKPTIWHVRSVRGGGFIHL
jgi:N-acetylgalactosamine kinase